jgi:hypothetical protein
MSSSDELMENNCVENNAVSCNHFQHKTVSRGVLVNGG